MLLFLDARAGWMPFEDGRLPAAWTWLAICCALAAAGMWVVWRLPRRAATPEPACGRCGYFVTGLSGTVCPECGSDLRAVGILAPGDVRQASAVLKLAILALLLPLPVVIGWRIVRPVLPKRYQQMNFIRLEDPRSGEYRRIVIDAFGSRWALRAPPSIPRTYFRVYTEGGAPLSFIIDLRPHRTMDARALKGPVFHSMEQVRPELLMDRIVGDAEVRRKNIRLPAEMNGLVELLRSASTTGEMTPTAGPAWYSVTNRGGVFPSMPIWMPAFWAGLWLLLALLIARRILRRPAMSDRRITFGATKTSV